MVREILEGTVEKVVLTPSLWDLAHN
jgi:hypothetical protein